MTSREYLEILRRLPIENPTEQDMIALCPHLTPEEAVAAFAVEHPYVAVPGIRIAGAFHVINFLPGHEEKDPSLDYAFSKRLDDTAATEQQRRAVAYARSHWGNELIEDTWQSVLQIILQDPTKLHPAPTGPGYPTTVTYLWLCLDRGYNKIHNDPSAPEFELLEKSIVFSTTDPAIAAELKGGRGAFTDYNCANCGGGLDLNYCTGCGVEFTDNHVRSGHRTPLSAEMVEKLQNEGFSFAVDPAIAQRAERQRWEEEATAIARARA